MRSFLIILFTLGMLPFQAQDNFNIELVSNITMGESSSDIWGYVDDNGIEYAIIGTRNSTRIFSLADPTNPELKASIPGVSSSWRDIKTYKKFAYVIADSGSDGLLVINLTDIDNITFEKIHTPFTGGTVQKCHNLYIDEEIGILFLAGCNTSRGIMAFDVGANPENPPFISIISTRYSHDVFVQDNLVYASELNNGQLAIYYIEDISNSELLGAVKTTNFFTHNAWANDDNSYVFTTDEVSNGTLDSYDITDKTNPIKVDEFVPAAILGDGRVPHNTHFKDNYLITSWYSYGVVITDVSNPNKIIETGHFTTSASSGADCWGVYPFLPSGLILASDIANGLFVLEPTYDRAAYLTGLITDEETGDPIFDAKVKISTENPTFSSTDPQGSYLTGFVEEGNFTIEYDHPEYEKMILSVDLVKGETVTQDVKLEKSTKSIQRFKTISEATGQEIPGVSIRIENEELEYNTMSNEIGNAELTMVESTFTVIAGKWGYKYSVDDLEIDGSGEYIITLLEGYEDDFLFEYFWSYEGPNARGMWERVAPTKTSFEGSTSNPGSDLPDDFGNQCYVTGNGSGGAGQHDIDDGTFILTSPIMDLSEAPDAELSYHSWFFNDGGSGTEPNDSFNIFVTNQSDTVLLETIAENTDGWSEATVFNLGEYISLNDSIQIIFEASDDIEFGHLVEAAVDGFLVRLRTQVSVEDDIVATSKLKLSPNPTSQGVYVSYPNNLSNVTISVYNLAGVRVTNIVLPSLEANSPYYLEGPAEKGIYIVELSSNRALISTEKFVKL